MYWIFIKNIVADSLSQAFPVIKYEQFMEIMGIEEKKELLAFIKLEDNLRDAF